LIIMPTLLKPNRELMLFTEKAYYQNLLLALDSAFILQAQRLAHRQFKGARFCSFFSKI